MKEVKRRRAEDVKKIENCLTVFMAKFEIKVLGLITFFLFSV